MEFTGQDLKLSPASCLQHTSFCDRMLATDSSLLRVAWWVFFFLVGSIVLLFLCLHMSQRGKATIHQLSPQPWLPPRMIALALRLA